MLTFATGALLTFICKGQRVFIFLFEEFIFSKHLNKQYCLSKKEWFVPPNADKVCALTYVLLSTILSVKL